MAKEKNAELVPLRGKDKHRHRRAAAFVPTLLTRMVWRCFLLFFLLGLTQQGGLGLRPERAPAAAARKNATDTTQTKKQRSYGILGDAFASLLGGVWWSKPAAPRAYDEETLRDFFGLPQGRRRVVSSERNPLPPKPPTQAGSINPFLSQLKNLLEPFVLFLAKDDGGLRRSVDKLNTWEALEKNRTESCDTYVTGGLGAL